MSEKEVLALIAAAAGIIGAFKFPEVIKNIQETLAMKNKNLLKKIAYQKKKIFEQSQRIRKYEELEYKLPLIIDFVRIKNKDDDDVLKLLDMIDTHLAQITPAPNYYDPDSEKNKERNNKDNQNEDYEN